MLTDHEKRRILKSWRLVVPIADTAADLFYRRVFELNPEYRRHFSDDMTRQKGKLVKMLSFIVGALDWSEENWADEVDPEDDLFMVVIAMGRRHGKLYKIPENSYAPIGEALLWALDQGLGDAFDDELKTAWGKLYGALAKIMHMGDRHGRLELEFGRKS